MATKLKHINLAQAQKYLLYLFVFLLPWQTRWIFLDSEIPFQQMSIYSFDIILVLLLLASLVSNINTRHSKKLLNFWIFPAKIKDEIRKKIFISSYSLLLTLSLASIIWSTNQPLAFFWTIKLALAYSLIWSLGKTNFSFKKLAWVLVISISIQALLGIGQFITQDDLVATKWLGASVQESSTLGTSVIETEKGRWLRAHGTQPHPNVLGGLLVIGIIFNFFLLRVTDYSPRWSLSEAGRLRITKIVLNSIFLILTAALFLTFSRSAWLAIGLITTIWLLTSKNLKSYVQKLGLIAPAVTLIIILNIIYQPLVDSRFSGSARLEQQSITERSSQLEQSYSILKTNPLLGVGTGNYTTALQIKFPELRTYQIQPVHNIYILILVELGIVGFIFFLLILKSYIINLKSIQNQQLTGVLVSLLATTLIISLFDHYFWSLPSMFFLFWLIIGLINSNQLKVIDK